MVCSRTITDEGFFDIMVMFDFKLKGENYETDKFGDQLNKFIIYFLALYACIGCFFVGIYQICLKECSVDE